MEVDGKESDIGQRRLAEHDGRHALEQGWATFACREGELSPVTKGVPQLLVRNPLANTFKGRP